MLVKNYWKHHKINIAPKNHKTLHFSYIKSVQNENKTLTVTNDTKKMRNRKNKRKPGTENNASSGDDGGFN